MKYHFIGIGGIGMSGLARLMSQTGHEISGCDVKKTEIPDKKIKTFLGHDPEHIAEDLNGVVVTSAALHDNSPAKPEIERAKELRVPIIKRSEMIGKLMRDKIGIAVSGMHGKTTTSSMIALILENAGLDPAALIGSEVKEWGKNYRFGKGKYFVAEACEYEKQMLDIKAKIVLITNLDEEHLDTYPGGMKDIKQAFKKFIKKIPKDGLLVVWREDKNLMALTKAAKCKVKHFSFSEPWPGLKLKILGKHNLLDATAAARVCHEIGVGQEIIKETLNNYGGAARRFEIKGEKNGVTVIDDYGHHPTEIKAAIEMMKEYREINTKKYPESRIIVAFQPHQYLRTKLLFDDFVKSFDPVDKLIVADIYLIAGREPAEARADFSKKLVEEIKKRNVNADYIGNYQDISKELKKITGKGDIVLTLGATDIYEVGEQFLK